MELPLIDGEMTMEERYPRMAYSVDEAALQANIGRDKIYAAIRDGTLEAKKAGRRTLVTAEALRRFIDRLPALHLPSKVAA